LAVAPEFVLVKRFYKVEGADCNLSEATELIKVMEP